MMSRVLLTTVLAVSLLGPTAVLASDADELADLPPAVPAGTYVGSVDDELILATAWSDIGTKIKANRVELRVAEDGSVGGRLEFEERGIAQAAVDPNLKCPGGGSRLLAKIDPGQVIGPELPQKLHVSLEYELYSTYTGKITPKEVEHWCIEPRPTIHTDKHKMVITGYASGKVTGIVDPWAFELLGDGAAQAEAPAKDPDRANVADERIEQEDASDAVKPYLNATKLLQSMVLDESLPAKVRERAYWQTQALKLLVPGAAGDSQTGSSRWIGAFANVLAAAPIPQEGLDAIARLADPAKGPAIADDRGSRADTRPSKPPPTMKRKHVKAGREWVSLDVDHEVGKIVPKVDPKTKKRRWARKGRVTLTTGTWYQAKENRNKAIIFYDTTGRPIGVAGRDDKRGLQYETWDPKVSGSP